MVPLIPLSSLQTAPAKHGTPAFDFLRIRAFWAISSRHLRAPRCSNLSRMVKKRDESVLVSLLSFPTRPPAQQKMKNSLDATFRFDFYPKIRAYTGTQSLPKLKANGQKARQDRVSVTLKLSNATALAQQKMKNSLDATFRSDFFPSEKLG